MISKWVEDAPCQSGFLENNVGFLVARINSNNPGHCYSNIKTFANRLAENQHNFKITGKLEHLCESGLKFSITESLQTYKTLHHGFAQTTIAPFHLNKEHMSIVLF